MEPRTLQLMELPTQQQIEDVGNNQAAGSSANTDFWRSRTRWIPTPDQISILKDLYYDKGVKCPTTEHIHEICLQLNQYGQVEGKNIYFWFQNVRVRERQMKRCNQAAQVPMGTSSPGTGGSIDLNFGPGSVDPYFSSPFTTSTSTTFFGRNEEQTSMEQRGEDHQEIETLPLFPMHDEDIGNKKTPSEGGSSYDDYSGGGYNGGSRIVLELSLNSSGSVDMA